MSDTIVTDARLVAGHLAGDRSALAGIYDRYADSLYDTAAAMVRNRHDAADIMQDVFVVAAERMEQLRDPDRLKPWLFAILRNEVYRRTGKKQRTVATDFTDAAAEMALPSQPADEGSDLEYQELAELVRGAAAGLDERDQLVLEYSVRRGLQGDDLAAALGVSAQQCYGLVHRMRQRTERSLGAYCVAKRGRRECAELAEILAGWDGEFSVLIRKRVARHVDRCDTCERSRRKLAPLALFGAAPAFAAPADLRDRVLVAAGNGNADPAYGFAAPGGFPSVTKYARRLGLWIALGLLTLLLAAGAAAYVFAAGDDDQIATAEIAATRATTTIGPTGDGPATTVVGADGTGVAPGASVAPAEPAPGASVATGDTTTSTTSIPATSPGVTAPGDPTTTSSSMPSIAVLPPVDRTADTTVPPAATSPTVVTSPPVVITTPTTAAPPPPPPTTTAPPPPTTAPPAPGALTVSAGALDFGRSLDRAVVTLSNTGGQSVTWSSATAPSGFRGVATAFTSAPTSGSLAPGASVDVTVVIDRTWPIEGPLKPARITFVAAGTSADVALTAEIAREPDLTIVVPPPRQLCFAGSGLFWEVTIADETLPITAVARIALPDGTSISVTFIEDGAFWYGGTVLDPSRKGSVPTGLWKWTVIATDGFGNAARTSGTTDVQRRFC